MNKSNIFFTLAALACAASVAAALPTVVERSEAHERARMARQCAYYGDEISRHADANNQPNPCEGI